MVFSSQRAETPPLELLDPALVNFADGDGVEVVELLAPAADRGNQVGVLPPPQVLRHRLVPPYGVVKSDSTPSACPTRELQSFDNETGRT